MSALAHRSIDIRRLEASQSEEQLAELEMRTRARISALLMALGVLHVTGILLNLVGPWLWSWHQACASVGITVHIASLIMTGVCVRYAHRPDLSVARLVDMVLVFEVLTALGIGFAEETRPVHGVSFVAILIAFFPLFVTTSTRRTLVASLLAASMPLVAHAGSSYLTGGHRLTWVGYLPYALNYLFAGFAVVPAKIMAMLAHDVRAARRLGAYQLVEKLGAGGMGEVWKANHRLLRRPAAIKLIKFSAAESDPIVRKRLLERFEQEAQVTASLKSPHTVALYDFGMASDATFYHVMELLDGLDLETLVRRFGPIPAERAIFILLQACDALEDAHRVGLVHRDIKPANIFLARLGRRTDFVKVLDFGLAKDRRPGRDEGAVWTTQPRHTPGTPAFMAPEQVIGADPIDERADIYALGCVAYWLVTGSLVFEESLPMAMMVAHTTRAPTPPSRRTKLAIPAALDSLILSCLAKAPEDRPQSADELARALAALDLPEWSSEQAGAWWREHLTEHADPASGVTHRATALAEASVLTCSRTLVGAGLVTMLATAACSRPTSEPTPVAEASAEPSTAPSSTSVGLPRPPTEPGAMAPRLRATEDVLLMTWLEPIAAADGDAGPPAKSHRVRFARLANGKWSAASTITEGPNVVANWADAPSAMRAGDGTLVAHWPEKSGDKAYAYDVVLARSTDGGKVWRRIGRAHDDGTRTEHGFVSLVPEGKGVRAFWLDGRETASDGGHGKGAMTLRTAVVTDSAVTDGELVDGRVCDCCGTSAAITSSGPLIAYRDRQGEEIRDIALVGRAAEGWSEPRLVHADGWRMPGCPVNGPMLAADGNRVAVAWYTYVDHGPRIRLSLLKDAGATTSAPIEIDQPAGRRSPIGRVDVVIDGDGAIVSWMASEREDAVLLVAHVPADGRVGEPLTVARTTASRDGGFPQLERLGDRLIFAWTKAGKPSQVEMRMLSVSDLPPPKVTKRAAPEATSGLLAVGAKAPEYRAQLLDGKEISLSSLRGEVVLFNLWATWCGPCRQELRELTELHQRYRSSGVRIVAVSVDGERTASDIRTFTERRKLPYAIWHDPDDRASTAFGVDTLPANFIIDRDGTIVWSRAGALSARDEPLTRALDAAIARPR